MPLVTSAEMFKKAYAGGYAIGAFNVNNMEIVQGITEAAKEVNSPLILQVSKGARAYANHTYLIKLVEAAVIETGLPIVLHLDHGNRQVTLILRAQPHVHASIRAVRLRASRISLSLIERLNQRLEPLPLEATENLCVPLVRYFLPRLLQQS